MFRDEPFFYFANNFIWKDLNLWNGQDLMNCVNLI